MSETTDTTTVDTTVTTGAPAATGETFSLEYVQSLRGEAAKYRTEKNSAVEAAKAQVAQEWETKLTTRNGEYTELESQLGASGIELTKIRTALALNVPSDKVLAFAEILKGATEDEIKASAESAKELFGGFKTSAIPTDPTQGSGQGAIALNGDPLLAALKSAVGIR